MAKVAAERPNSLHLATALVALVAIGKDAMTAAGFSAGLAAGFHNAITTGGVRSTDSDDRRFDAGPSAWRWHFLGPTQAPSDTTAAGDVGLNPRMKPVSPGVEIAVVALAGCSNREGLLADFAEGR